MRAANEIASVRFSVMCFLNAPSLARASCVSKDWHRDSNVVWQVIRDRAARKIQCSIRYVLANIRVLDIRRTDFELMLHSPSRYTSLFDIPHCNWVAYQACMISNFGAMWATSKLQAYDMPVACEAALAGSSLMASFALARKLTIEQMMCLGI